MSQVKGAANRGTFVHHGARRGQARERGSLLTLLRALRRHRGRRGLAALGHGGGGAVAMSVEIV